MRNPERYGNAGKTPHPATPSLVPPEYDDSRHLRHVGMVPFVDGKRWTLRTWEPLGAPRFKTGQYKIGYQLSDPDGRVLFEGEDCGVAPSHGLDSDDALRGLLGFLTLKPGDTDPDYFENYTDEQWSFCQSYACETLSMWSLERDDENEADPFENLDGWTND